MSTEEQRDFWRNRLITANKAMDRIAEERNTAEKQRDEALAERDRLALIARAGREVRDEALARVGRAESKAVEFGKVADDIRSAAEARATQAEAALEERTRALDGLIDAVESYFNRPGRNGLQAFSLDTPGARIRKAVVDASAALESERSTDG